MGLVKLVPLGHCLVVLDTERSKVRDVVADASFELVESVWIIVGCRSQILGFRLDFCVRRDQLRDALAELLGVGLVELTLVRAMHLRSIVGHPC